MAGVTMEQVSWLKATLPTKQLLLDLTHLASIHSHHHQQRRIAHLLQQLYLSQGMMLKKYSQCWGCKVKALGGLWHLIIQEHLGVLVIRRA